MALADTTLVPMEAERLASTLTFASKNDALTFDIAGRDYVTLQFDSASAWPAGAVITVQTALAPSRFSGAAVYTALGIIPFPIFVRPAVEMKVYVSTTAGSGGETVKVIARAFNTGTILT